MNLSGAVEPAISLEDVHIGFEEGDVLRGVSFEVYPRETLILLGETGTGKTLTLKIPAGLLKPAAGRVRLLGEPISEKLEKEILYMRGDIGFVFQEVALFHST